MHISDRRAAYAAKMADILAGPNPNYYQYMVPATILLRYLNHLCHRQIQANAVDSDAAA